MFGDHFFNFLYSHQYWLSVDLNPFKQLVRHVIQNKHAFSVDYVEILERNVNNMQERLFPEALHSFQDHNSVNEHKYSHRFINL